METLLREDLTVADLSSLIKSRRLSVSEILESYLSRIADHDSVHHAYRSVFVEEARKQALQLDAELNAGKWRGPLHGIPVAVKDNIDVVGEITAAGSAVYSPEPATQDALAIRRLRDAGAIILGHTHMVEFAFGGWGTNSATGTPRNPLDLVRHRVPGGSSSGSAVAVGAGLTPIALGTDTGGSVRIPAAMVGLTAFKPSWGLVSDEGLTALCKKFDVIGPMGRTVGDCWNVLQAMLPADSALSAELSLPKRALRIGIADPVSYGSCSERVLTAFRETCDVLSKAGLQLEPFELPIHVDEVLARTGCLIGHEAVSRFGGVLSDAPERLDRGVRYRLTDAQKRFNQDDYEREMQIRDEKCREMQNAMAGFDALIFPTVPVLSSPIDEIIERAMPLGDLTRVVNYFDLCAMALPDAVTEEGLRHSIQIIGAHGHDELICSLSLQVEQILAARYGDDHGSR